VVATAPSVLQQYRPSRTVQPPPSPCRLLRTMPQPSAGPAAGPRRAGRAIYLHTNPVAGNCTVTVTFNPSPVNGQCGSAHNQTLTAAPASNLLCAKGTESAVTGTGPWTWFCTGVNGGSTASCWAYIQTWTVTGSVTNGGGTISCDSPVSHGSSSTCTISPNNGISLQP